MASGDHSFIDIAALDDVRERFARGEALAILSVSLDEILWANGPGAALFGYRDIEAIMGAPTGLDPAARRQITSTANFPAIGTDRPLTVRVSSGMSSRATDFQASELRLPNGERAILLARRAPTHVALDPEKAAAEAISGITNHGHYAAMVDLHGDVLASSEGYQALGITRETLRKLIIEVAAEVDRVTKRLIAAGRGTLPAGFVRLTDDPALHFLIVVDESALGFDDEPLDQDDAQADPGPRATPVSPTEAKAPMVPETPEALLPEPPVPDAVTIVTVEPETVMPDPDSPTQEMSPSTDREPLEEPEVHADPTPDQEAQESDARRVADPAPIIVDGNERGPSEPQGMPDEPVRFVWRTDAETRFIAISPEFTAAAGLVQDDILGQPFVEVASRFGIDPRNEIAGLLERRDTWSGRSVAWRLEARSVSVPVDLAALPVYSRDRSFEGFRGFGVARFGEVTPLQPRVTRLAPTSEDVPSKDTDPAVDPFRGETPAIDLQPTPERRLADKVIRLAEHRTEPREAPEEPGRERALSPSEAIAFREIRERLRRVETPAPDDATPVSRGDFEPAPPVDEAPGELTEEPFADAAGPADMLLQKEPSEPGSPDVEEDNPVQEYASPPAVAEPVATDAVPDTQSEPQPSPRPVRNRDFVPSAFAPHAGGDGPSRADTTILARLPMPVLIHSGDRLHYANPAFLELTGHESLEALSSAGGLDELFADPIEEATRDRSDLVLRKTNGDMIPVEALLHSVPWEGGRALMLALRDTSGDPVSLSGRVRGATSPLDIELRARVAEMRSILDTATDGVVLIGNDGTIRSINRPGEALFGFEADELSGKPFVSLFAVESQNAARDYLAGLNDNGFASVLNDGREVIGREAQGRFIPLFMTIGRLPADNGFCAVMRDITQWKRAEEELTQAKAEAERASSQKSDFLARISHEIRTPLNAIIGFSELMIDEKFGPIGNDRYKDYLRDINRSGSLVLDLVNDLLDISKIEAGEQEMNYEAVSLNETLSEVVAMMQPQANRERVIIRSSFASRLPEIVADPRSVRQIAMNLLSNAVRFTQAGGQVIISTAYEASGDVVLRVRDTGIGMSTAEIEQAMKPFKQINALKRSRSDGTGLGLPLTKAMVQANRARFEIVSTPGEGTLVEITFPATRVLAG